MSCLAYQVKTSLVSVPLLAWTPLLTWIAVGAATLFTVTSAFLIYLADLGSDRRFRAQKQSRSPDVAFRAVVSARFEFTKAVQAYEQALVSASEMASSSPTVQSDASESANFANLEHQKERKRARLLDAQRLWESVRPAPSPNSELDLWLGSGRLRSWQLGPVGRESVQIRLGHATDQDCWVVWVARRFRFGLGLGAESRRLVLVASGATIDQLEGLTSASFGGADVALRPGFSPLRLVRRFAEQRAVRQAKAPLLRQSDLTETHSETMARKRTELAEVLAEIESRDLESPGRLAVEHISMNVVSRGPALLFGVWVGRQPACHVRARSNHRAWRTRQHRIR